MKNFYEVNLPDLLADFYRKICLKIFKMIEKIMLEHCMQINRSTLMP